MLCPFTPLSFLWRYFRVMRQLRNHVTVPRLTKMVVRGEVTGQKGSQSALNVFWNLQAVELKRAVKHGKGQLERSCYSVSA